MCMTLIINAQPSNVDKQVFQDSAMLTVKHRKTVTDDQKDVFSKS
jgi:hypothetical protein